MITLTSWASLSIGMKPLLYTAIAVAFVAFLAMLWMTGGWPK